MRYIAAILGQFVGVLLAVALVVIVFLALGGADMARSMLGGR